MTTRLKNERQKLNVTAAYVASMVGLSKSGYINIEAGRRRPLIVVAFKLERFFKVPASELLAETKEEP
ncbi:helix-turn-helix transcriptional regulator [Syntrophomonas curvata]